MEKARKKNRAKSKMEGGQSQEEGGERRIPSKFQGTWRKEGRLTCWLSAVIWKWQPWAQKFRKEVDGLFKYERFKMDPSCLWTGNGMRWNSKFSKGQESSWTVDSGCVSQTLVTEMTHLLKSTRSCFILLPGGRARKARWCGVDMSWLLSFPSLITTGRR